MILDRRELLVGTLLGGAVAASPLPALARSPKLSFPEDFELGAATSSYQVEGAVREDGRGASIWDTFAAQPGKIEDGGTGEVACDSYRRWREDVALLKAMNLQAYRFSIAWPRIQPTGSGAPNGAGLDHYDRFVDALLAAGIRPAPTLYHWDLPQTLEDEGGWPSRDTAARFTDYAEIVAKRLGDRVEQWTVFNEPKTFTHLGYASGVHAPGRRDLAAFLRATHTVNLAYGDTYKLLKSLYPKCRVGSALDLAAIYPATPSSADAEAARRWDAFQNLWFISPAVTGSYPLEYLSPAEIELIGLAPGDGERLKAGFDFAGVNYYTPTIVASNPTRNGPLELGLEARWGVAPSGHRAKTSIGWEIHAPGLLALIRRTAEALPNTDIYVTENGAAYGEGPDGSGRIRDAARIAYLDAHLAAVAQACSERLPVRGYFAWSLLDNFEWAKGYSERFGLVWVDFAQRQTRIIKDSGLWYARLARSKHLST